MNRTRVYVIFGGRSGEHEVSIVSAESVMRALDPARYEVVPVGITKSGRWVTGEHCLEQLKSGIEDERSFALLAPDPNEHGLIALRSGDRAAAGVDVVFPVLHGPYGEDGTVQGLLELAGLPYVGSGVLGSSVCMDKVVQKQLTQAAGVPVGPYLWLFSRDWEEGSAKRAPGEDSAAAAAERARRQLTGMSRSEILARVARELGYPVFVKPANMGSSVGISKAHDERELVGAIEEAGRYDRKVLLEAAIPDAREIEVSVLGNERPRASVPGEVIPSNEFYDYDAKYVDQASTLIIPAPLEAAQVAAFQEAAIGGFLACACEGMARVDFLLERASGRFVLNEINTIPGFTSISMYPKLWEASGLPYPRLLEELIALAVERHRRKQRLQVSYQPKTEWYK